MKSKISFFNKTIYFKNITLFWPIWGLYLLYLILTGPAILGLDLRMMDMELKGFTDTDMLHTIMSAMSMENVVVTSFIVALIIAMALYNYLFTSKNANMIHSLPVSRNELFGTNLLSGITFLFVPQIITFLISVFVCLPYGGTGVEYLGTWLLVSMGVSFLAYSIAVFCAFLTGQLFAMPIYYIVINYLYEFIKALVGLVIEFIGFGVNSYEMNSSIHMDWLSPSSYLFNHLGWNTIRQGKQMRLQLVDGHVVALYLIPAVVLLVIAYICYKKRHIESAGSLVTVSFLKPVFRWGIGFAAGYFFGILVCYILEDFFIKVSAAGCFIIVLILSAIFFFIADMFLQKSFKVFQKKRMLELAGLAVFMLVSFLGINGSIFMLERYVPKQDKVAYATIDVDYLLEFEGEEIENIVEIHQMILEHMDEFKESVGSPYEDGYWIPITYYMKNGDVVTRHYELPDIEASETIYRKIVSYEEVTENYLNFLFGNPYEEAVITGGYLEYWEDGLSGWTATEIKAQDAQKLYEAAIKDAKSGALQKYNYENTAADEAYEVSLSLYVDNEKLKERLLKYREYYGIDDYFIDDYYIDDYINQEMMPYLYIGKDCTNLMQAIMELEFVKSEEELVESEEVMTTYQ